MPRVRLAKCIESRCQDCQPDIIYTHWIGDLNQDHRRVAEAAHYACACNGWIMDGMVTAAGLATLSGGATIEPREMPAQAIADNQKLIQEDEVSP